MGPGSFDAQFISPSREAGFRKSFAYAARPWIAAIAFFYFPKAGILPMERSIRFAQESDYWRRIWEFPFLPMRIDGLFEVKNSGRKFAAPGKICVRIGAPMKFAAESRSGRDCGHPAIGGGSAIADTPQVPSSFPRPDSRGAAVPT